MPSQSENKPYPVRMSPELREKVKEEGGGALVRGLLGGFFGEIQEPEVGRIEQDLAKLEALSLRKLDLKELDEVYFDAISVLNYVKAGTLKHHLALLLLGRVEWLRARKTKRTSRW